MDKTFTVKNDMALEDFLLKYSGQSKKSIHQAFMSRRLFVDDKVVTDKRQALKAGQTVRFMLESSLPILYEDRDLVVINKPAGLLSIADEHEKEKTAYHLVHEYVVKKDRKNKVFVLHRLDKDTSGILMFAKNVETQKLFQSKWNEYCLCRGYTALVHGIFKEKKGTLRYYLKENKARSVYIAKDGKLAVTDYEVIAERNHYSLVRCNLQTGRKHQIRVSLKAIGHPVAGDDRYGDDDVRRLCLCADRLKIRDPRSPNKVLSWAVPVPDFWSLVSKK